MTRVVVTQEARVYAPVPGFILEGPAYRHAHKVLRLGLGDAVRVVDGSGVEFQCVIEEVSHLCLRVRILGSRPLAGESGVQVCLAVALLKGDRTELVLQKATELGVAEVVLFECERAVVRTDGGGRHRERWERVVDAAVGQCGRADRPRVVGPVSFEEAAARVAESDVAVLLWEAEASRRLGEVLAEAGSPASVAVMVGPEGGFSAAEAERAASLGIRSVTLGRRILRAETAAIVAPAVILALLGDLA